MLFLECHRNLLGVILEVERQSQGRFVVLDVDVEDEIVFDPFVDRLGASCCCESLVDDFSKLDPARLGPLRREQSQTLEPQSPTEKLTWNACVTPSILTSLTLPSVPG